MAAGRKFLSTLNCIVAILLVFAILAAVAVRFSLLPRDVTYNAELNGGFVPHGIYTLQCRIVVVMEDKRMDPTTRYWATAADPDYVSRYVVDPKSGAVNPGFSFLEAGTRLQLERIVWHPAEMFHDGGGKAHPYARVLDGPSAGKLLFIRDISTVQEIQPGGNGSSICKPDPRFLKQAPW